jgi:Transposase IS116/IS110/IS902 family
VRPIFRRCVLGSNGALWNAFHNCSVAPQHPPSLPSGCEPPNQGSGSRIATLTMVFKLDLEAQKHWRRLNGSELIPRWALGSDRSMFPSSQALQCVAGTAPVSYQSGQIHKVYLRSHSNKFLRHTVQLWADLSRARSPCAQAYYQRQRSCGKSHACAIRARANAG